jgi:hypothetical protein
MNGAFARQCPAYLCIDAPSKLIIDQLLWSAKCRIYICHVPLHPAVIATLPCVEAPAHALIKFDVKHFAFAVLPG